METTNTQHTTEVIPADKEKIKQIIKVAVILGIVTALEFAVAFLMPHDMHTIKVAIFIGMTIVKAGYIVGEFMHLSHEVKSLLWSIILPMVFILWLIVAMLYEGNSVLESNMGY